MLPMQGQNKQEETAGWIVKEVEQSGVYDSYTEESYQKVINAFIDIGGLRSGQNVLDLGAATGEFSKRLNERGLSVVAVDIAYPLINIAVLRNGLMGVVADGERLPFADDSFDAVFCVDLLHHFMDADYLFGEVVRVVKPGGVFFVSDLNGYNPHTFLAQCHCSPVRYDYLNENESATFGKRVQSYFMSKGHDIIWAEYVFLSRKQRKNISGWRYRVYGFICTQIQGVAKRILAVVLFNIAHSITPILSSRFKGNVVWVAFRIHKK